MLQVSELWGNGLPFCNQWSCLMPPGCIQETVGLWNATRFGFNFGNFDMTQSPKRQTFLRHDKNLWNVCFGTTNISHSFGTYILFPGKMAQFRCELRPFTGPCCGSWVCHGLYASVVSWMSWNEVANDQMTCFGYADWLVGLWFLRILGGQEIEILYEILFLFHKVGRMMQHMQIFGNVSISSWVTLRQTRLICGNEQTARATQFSSAMKHLSRQLFAPLLWGSLSVLWRLLLQLAECEPCLCPGLKDETITWTFLNMKLKILEVEIDSWRLRDHQRFQFHVESTWCWMSRQLQNYHFLRCSRVSIVKLPWSPWFSMSQVSLPLLTCWVKLLS